MNYPNTPQIGEVESPAGAAFPTPVEPPPENIEVQEDILERIRKLDEKINPYLNQATPSAAPDNTERGDYPVDMAGNVSRLFGRAINEGYKEYGSPDRDGRDAQGQATILPAEDYETGMSADKQGEEMVRLNKELYSLVQSGEIDNDQHFNIFNAPVDESKFQKVYSDWVYGRKKLSEKAISVMGRLYALHRRSQSAKILQSRFDEATALGVNVAGFETGIGAGTGKIRIQKLLEQQLGIGEIGKTDIKLNPLAWVIGKDTPWWLGGELSIGSLSAVVGFVTELLFDPTTYLTFGVGKVVTMIPAKQVSAAIAKSTLIPALARPVAFRQGDIRLTEQGVKLLYELKAFVGKDEAISILASSLSVANKYSARVGAEMLTSKIGRTVTASEVLSLSKRRGIGLGIPFTRWETGRLPTGRYLKQFADMLRLRGEMLVNKSAEKLIAKDPVFYSYAKRLYTGVDKTVEALSRLFVGPSRLPHLQELSKLRNRVKMGKSRAIVDEFVAIADEYKSILRNPELRKSVNREIWDRVEEDIVKSEFNLAARKEAAIGYAIQHEPVALTVKKAPEVIKDKAGEIIIPLDEMVADVKIWFAKIAKMDVELYKILDQSQVISSYAYRELSDEARQFAIKHNFLTSGGGYKEFTTWMSSQEGRKLGNYRHNYIQELAREGNLSRIFGEQSQWRDFRGDFYVDDMLEGMLRRALNSVKTGENAVMVRDALDTFAYKKIKATYNLEIDRALREFPDATSYRELSGATVGLEEAMAGRAMATGEYVYIVNREIAENLKQTCRFLVNQEDEAVLWWKSFSKNYDDFITNWQKQATIIRPDYHLANAISDYYRWFSWKALGDTIPEITHNFRYSNNLSLSVMKDRGYFNDMNKKIFGEKIGGIIDKYKVPVPLEATKKLTEKEMALANEWLDEAIYYNVFTLGSFDDTMMLRAGALPNREYQRELMKVIYGVDVPPRGLMDAIFKYSQFEKLSDIGANLGAYAENQRRLALYFAQRYQGKSVPKALEVVDKIMYTSRMYTEFEKKYARRIIMFYGWMRNNIPAMIENLVLHPFEALFPYRVINSIRMNSQDEDELIKELYPAYVHDNWGVPIRRVGGEQQMFLAGRYFSVSDLWSKGIFSTLSGDTDKTTKFLLNSLTPAIKGGLNVAGYELAPIWSDRNIAPIPTEQTEFLGIEMSRRVAQATKSLFPALYLADRLVSGKLSIPEFVTGIRTVGLKEVQLLEGGSYRANNMIRELSGQIKKLAKRSEEALNTGNKDKAISLVGDATALQTDREAWRIRLREITRKLRELGERKELKVSADKALRRVKAKLEEGEE